MPEHFEVGKNGNHGSDVQLGQKTDMLSWMQLSERAQPERDYFLQSPQEVMFTSEMRVSLFNVRKKMGFF